MPDKDMFAWADLLRDRYGILWPVDTAIPDEEDVE